MRRWLKSAALAAADRVLPGFGRAPVVILAFHAVPDRVLFSAQLDALAALRWPVVSLDEVLAWQAGGAAWRGPALALTFDDGRCDQVAHAAPELRRRGWPATFFVVAGCLGQHADWSKESADEPAFPLADATAVRQLDALGFAVGCHTRTHRSLRGAEPTTLAAEVAGARFELGALLGLEVRWLCYPYGHYDAAAVAAARTAGFVAACTTVPATVPRGGDPFCLPRMTVPPYALPVEVRAYARGTVLGYRRLRNLLRALRRPRPTPVLGGTQSAPEGAQPRRDSPGPVSLGAEVGERAMSVEPAKPGAVMTSRVRLVDEEWVRPDPQSGLFLAHLRRYVFAARYAAGARVLDVGCGPGYGAARLAAVARCCLGVDADPAALAYARAHYRRPNLGFAQMRAQRLALPDGVADLATCFEVVEHLLDEHALLAELARVLRPGGWLLLSTPNRLVDEPHMRSIGLRHPYHVNLLTPAGLRAALRRHFRQVRLYGQWRRGSALHAALKALDLWNLRLRLVPARRRAAVLQAIGSAPPPRPALGETVIAPGLLRQSPTLVAVCRR